MRVQIEEWDDDAAICLPDDVIKELDLKPGDAIDLTVENGEIVLRRSDVEALRSKDEDDPKL